MTTKTRLALQDVAARLQKIRAGLAVASALPRGKRPTSRKSPALAPLIEALDDAIMEIDAIRG